MREQDLRNVDYFLSHECVIKRYNGETRADASILANDLIMLDWPNLPGCADVWGPVWDKLNMVSDPSTQIGVK